MKQFSRTRIVLSLLAIFLAVAVTGWFGAFQMMRHFRPGSGSMTAHLVHELQTRLILTPEQVQKIEPVISNTFAQFGNTMSRDVSQSLSNCNARIAAELTPEQIAKFAVIEQEQRDFLRTRFGAGPASFAVTNSTAGGH